MDVHDFSEKSVLLTDVSPFVFGTTRLGDERIPFDDRVEMAKAAVDTGVWFHTSRWYGNALDVLNKAFDIDRSKVPNMIVKLGGETIDEFKTDIKNNFEPMGVNTIDVGQLCLGGSLAIDFANGGDCYYELEKIKKNKIVKRFVLEVFPWTSHIALKALKGGYTKGLVDGVIFYLNPLQRFASNELWELLNEQYEPIIALRTVAGGPVDRLSNEPDFAWKPYLQKRASQILPIFEKSGIESWTEFCMRFAHSFTQVRATVGATSNAENFEQFLLASENIEPLPDEIINEIVQWHFRWSTEEDMKAEPWSM
ncbi:MAG: hypothetical protein JW735_07420 [Prolixibacteraceae bacterium]|nr:hypothetical protein [Prolixibacteraceae bacterium]